MNDIGLDKRELDLFYSLFRKFSDIEKVILFGSRAKGTFKANSDIDLVISGIDTDLDIESLAKAKIPLVLRIKVLFAHEQPDPGNSNHSTGKGPHGHMLLVKVDGKGNDAHWGHG